jgi:hypothetical protein
VGGLVTLSRTSQLRRVQIARQRQPIKRTTRLRLVSERQRTVEAGRRILKLLLLDVRGSRCARCGTYGPLDMHERKKRSQGGPFDPTNCLLVCRFPCHQWTEDEPDAARADGYVVTSRHDPASQAVKVWPGRWVLLLPDGSYEDATDGAA